MLFGKAAEALAKSEDGVHKCKTLHTALPLAEKSSDDKGCRHVDRRRSDGQQALYVIASHPSRLEQRVQPVHIALLPLCVHQPLALTGDFNCGAFVAGIIEAVLEGANFVSGCHPSCHYGTA